MKFTTNPKENTMKQITATLAVTFSLAASLAAGAGAQTTPSAKHFHGISNPSFKRFHAIDSPSAKHFHSVKRSALHLA